MATTHGMRYTRIYATWTDMKRRCCNPHSPKYARYGGRGITICTEWRDSFSAFHEWAMANGYRDDLTIDRIDNDGNYEPANCRWIPAAAQAANKSTNHYVTVGDDRHTIAEWARITGLSPSTLSSRLTRCGWEPERAVYEPPVRPARNKSKIYS